MASIFISHSSLDKEFVRRLASDLKSLGNIVWLDEWEIRPGDCIQSKLEDGINKAQYILVIISNSSNRSSWVEKEWKSKHWEEVNSRKVSVIPALIEDCEIPQTLRTKKYVDFRDYSVALAELNKTISSPGRQSNEMPEKFGSVTILDALVCAGRRLEKAQSRRSESFENTLSSLIDADTTNKGLIKSVAYRHKVMSEDIFEAYRTLVDAWINYDSPKSLYSAVGKSVDYIEQVIDHSHAFVEKLSYADLERTGEDEGIYVMLKDLEKAMECLSSCRDEIKSLISIPNN